MYFEHDLDGIKFEAALVKSWNSVFSFLTSFYPTEATHQCKQTPVHNKKLLLGYGYTP